jgi:aspartyl-tRNA(Asn)/glutamyl-tRNA(Gln) amidotransferase subunit B
MGEYDTVIGLEVHAQLITETKAFCTCPNRYGAPPNTLVCPICLGMPGILPVLNRAMLEQAMKLALAVGATIHPRSKFDRKNYFYPDLPKGYQISQYDEPFSTGGSIELTVDGHRRLIRIRRIHLEEDAGKSMHQADGSTIVDMNRCGVPLVEIVSEPDMSSPAEARVYLNEIRRLVRWLGVCDGNMEEGSLRCDANVSVRRKGSDQFGTATEVKNMNSIRGVERALAYEIERQIGVVESGGMVIRQTLLWDESEAIARPMRRKESSDDYRYFPEPDLVEVVVPSEWIERTRNQMPKRREQYINEFSERGVPKETVEVVTKDAPTALYAYGTMSYSDLPVESCNWIQKTVLKAVKDAGWDRINQNAPCNTSATLVIDIRMGNITSSQASEVFDIAVKTGQDPHQIITNKGVVQISDPREIEEVAREILAKFPNEVVKYKSGKKNLFGFFVGEVMKATKGQANPKIASEILQKLLSQ